MAGQLAANHPDDALQYLREAINRGYKDADGLMADPDLEKLHPQPELPATRRRTQNACPEQFSPISEGDFLVARHSSGPSRRCRRT